MKSWDYLISRDTIPIKATSEDVQDGQEKLRFSSMYIQYRNAIVDMLSELTNLRKWEMAILAV